MIQTYPRPARDSFSYRLSLVGLTNCMQERSRQRRGIENAHSRIFAHPRFAGRRIKSLKLRDVLCGAAPDPHQHAVVLAAVKDKPFGRPNVAVLDCSSARRLRTSAGRDERMAPAEQKNGPEEEDEYLSDIP